MSVISFIKPVCRREYCCTGCGLIWFDDTRFASEVTCPECLNHLGQLRNPVYPCDSYAYAYSYDNIKKRLEKKGKLIHYHKEHPYYKK